MSAAIQRFRQLLQDRDFRIAASAGLVPGVRPGTKFGYDLTNPVGDTDIWPGSAAYVFPDGAGQTVEAVSASPADSVSLKIEGIDAATQLTRVETVALDGTTPVPVPGSWLSINRAYNANGTPFVGEVLVRGTGAPNANVFAIVPVADQQTVQLPTMLPADKFGLITAIGLGINKSSGTDASAIARLSIARDGGVFRTQIRNGVQRNGTSAIPFELPHPMPVPPLSKIRLTADPSAEVDVSGLYGMLLLDIGLIEPDYLQQVEDS